MDRIMALAKNHGLKVVEDCAHAIETEYHGQKAGRFGDFGCFSFDATKNVVTGEGGMVITDDPHHAATIKSSSLHGLTKDSWERYSTQGFRHYQAVTLGFKYNMMDLQAAMGIHQLARVEANWLRRQEIWDSYQSSLADTSLILPQDPEPGTRHAYHLYTVLVEEERTGISRDDFLDAMTEQGIGVGVHYLSIPEHPYHRENFGWKAEDYPYAMRVGRQTVSLPLSPKLTEGDVVDVIKAVGRVLS